MSRILVTLAVLAGLLTGCTSTTAQLKLAIATGFDGGVYNKLGKALAAEWSTQTGMVKPEVLQTNGSPENLDKLSGGQADVAFSAADVAIAERDDHANVRALARIYDDYLHIVVRSDSAITSVAGLAGKRIAIGAPDSGVQVIANKVLGLAKIQGDVRNLRLRDSTAALKDGTIDAFFWSGGLPTDEIAQLAREVPVRLLDLSDLMRDIRAKYSFYSAAVVPLSVYQLGNTTPVTTLTVQNLLLVTDRMSVETAKALTQGIFEAQSKLAEVSKAASSIDLRSAIETHPVPLHPGALEFYRDDKL